jgi:hypothetical protein
MPVRDLPSAVALSPPLHRAARRASTATRRLVDALVAAFPDALALARDPGLAERIDTTPYDPVAAGAITAARSLLAAIDDLEHPEPVSVPQAPADDDSSF